MAKRPEYRYVLYDESGTYVDAVFGINNKVIADYLKKRGWTGLGFSRISDKFTKQLKPGQRASKVYGRDRKKKVRNEQFRHLYIIREPWVAEMEYADFRIPELAGT